MQWCELLVPGTLSTSVTNDDKLDVGIGVLLEKLDKFCYLKVLSDILLATDSSDLAVLVL